MYLHTRRLEKTIMERIPCRSHPSPYPGFFQPAKRHLPFVPRKCEQFFLKRRLGRDGFLVDFSLLFFFHFSSVRWLVIYFFRSSAALNRPFFFYLEPVLLCAA